MHLEERNFGVGEASQLANAGTLFFFRDSRTGHPQL